MPPDERVAAFGDSYRELAVNLTDGRVALEAGTLTNRSARFVEFAIDHPAPKPFSLQHKLHFGQLDLRVPGWTATTLEAHLTALDVGQQPPEGWQVALPRKARVSKATGEVTPVLRLELDEIPPELPPFEEVRHIVAKAVGAASALGVWLDEHRASILGHGPDADTLIAVLGSAEMTAKQLRLTAVEQHITRARDAITQPDRVL